jgi:hypothetical protein
MAVVQSREQRTEKQEQLEEQEEEQQQDERPEKKYCSNWPSGLLCGRPTLAVVQ